MNFEDEEYVRVYTKKTNTFRKLGWEGRTVLWHLFIEADKAGYIEFDEGDDLVESVAELIDMPKEIVRIGLERLASRGVTTRHGASLIIERFVEAQEAKRSDRLRAQDYRDRKRASSSGETAHSSRIVTTNHETSLPASPPLPIPLPPPATEGTRATQAVITSARRQELSLQQASPDDIAIFNAWRERFEITDAHFTADRALPLRARRAEDMTQRDALDALAGAATDVWFMRQGKKLKLIFNDRERFETYRNIGRDIRAGRPPPPKIGVNSAPRQPDSGYRPSEHAREIT